MKKIYTLLVVLGLALVVLGLAWFFYPFVGTDYYIETQSDFDKLKQATFSAGDNIVFQKGRRFKGMFAPQGQGERGRRFELAVSVKEKKDRESMPKERNRLGSF